MVRSDDQHIIAEESDENGEIFFSQLATLFRLCDSTWEQVGVGKAQLPKQKETGMVWFVFAHVKTSKILARHCVDTERYCDLDSDSSAVMKHSWTWQAEDSAQGTLKVETFALKFNNPQQHKEFERAFNEAKQINSKVVAEQSEENVETVEGDEDDSEEIAIVNPPSSSVVRRPSFPVESYSQRNGADDTALVEAAEAIDPKIWRVPTDYIKMVKLMREIQDHITTTKGLFQSFMYRKVDQTNSVPFAIAKDRFIQALNSGDEQMLKDWTEMVEGRLQPINKKVLELMQNLECQWGLERAPMYQDLLLNIEETDSLIQKWKQDNFDQLQAYWQYPDGIHAWTQKWITVLSAKHVKEAEKVLAESNQESSATGGSGPAFLTWWQQLLRGPRA